MDLENRKAIYAEVERIREEIENAFQNWHLQDISIGHPRPSVEDLIDELDIIIHPAIDIKSTATTRGRFVERDDGSLAIEWEML